MKAVRDQKRLLGRSGVLTKLLRQRDRGGTFQTQGKMYAKVPDMNAWRILRTLCRAKGGSSGKSHGRKAEAGWLVQDRMVESADFILDLMGLSRTQVT